MDSSAELLLGIHVEDVDAWSELIRELEDEFPGVALRVVR
jgi:hypothetical protein